jgi:hypothetical protein
MRWRRRSSQAEHVPEQTKRELAPIVGSTVMSIVVTGSIAYDYLMSFPGGSPSISCRSTSNASA